MSLEQSPDPRRDTAGRFPLELKEIVMGLHWDAPKRRSGAGNTADLDALCVLFDAEDRVLEVVRPGNERAAGSSIVHTGDSMDGSGAWDDERIFVFLDAVPPSVRRLEFVVRSAAGHPFDMIDGAYCHVSDRISEEEIVRVELTRLTGATSHMVAAVRRSDNGWNLDPAGNAVRAPIHQ